MKDVTLLETEKFDVIKREQRIGDRVLHRHIVLHPGAAVIVPVLADGRVLLIRNRRLSIGKTLLELPAGTLEIGETPERCAVRELEEETGYRATSVQPLISFYATPGICTERMYGFLAEKLQRGGQSLDEGEDIEVSPYPASAIHGLIRGGEIEDGKTIALLLYWLHLRAAGDDDR